MGPLEVVRVIGSGAHGTVYETRHSGLGRRSALKVVPGGALEPVRRTRFENEIVAQARLDHPGIVKIYGAWEVHGALACELEFVEGGNLEQRLERGPLPWTEAAALIATVARAVDHAHRHGVVHRDLKPANVLLRPGGAPVVADLGIAMLVDRAASIVQRAAAGTPLYMAPEAFDGSWSPAVDVYALGAILSECLTGRPPFQADNILELLVRVTGGACEPLDVPGLPPGLEAARARAMAIDPGARHATAAELAEELERLDPARSSRAVMSGLVAAALPALAATAGFALGFLAGRLL